MTPFALLRLLPLAVLAACAGPDGGSDLVQDSAAQCTVRRQGELVLATLQRIPTTQVLMDGRPITVLFDTGATGSLITAATLSRLALPQDLNRVFGIHGLGGLSYGHPVQVKQLELGGAQMTDRVLGVGEDTFRRMGADQPDGLIGSDILGEFDVDLDLPHARAVLYRGRACPSGGPGWAGPYVTLAPPAPALPGGLAWLPVTLDGHELAAFLDTGASLTTVDRASLGLLGVTPAMLEHDPSASVIAAGPSAVRSRVHRFREMRVAGETWHNVNVGVADLPAGEMLLGLDFLRRHRVWISYKSHLVFIAPPGAMQAAE